jgi:hypothetical protein
VDKKIDWLEIGIVVIGLILSIAFCSYHVSFNGYLGLTTSQWKLEWATSQNLFSLFMVILIVIAYSGTIHCFFKYVFAPYFIIKLLYHISCYSGLYLFSPQVWEVIWSFIIVALIGIGLIYCIQLIRKGGKYVD